MKEVVIVGAGPAGAVAATVLARAGARVRLVDRATFPRDKLCGDTVNPGTVAMLERLGMHRVVMKGLAVDGMIVTSEHACVRARYPKQLTGRALSRRDLDQALLAMAIDAGAAFEAPVTVLRARVDSSQLQPRATGVVVRSNGGERVIDAHILIAADGRRSRVAFGAGVAHHPARPRRWAIGAYFEGVAGLSSFGEMHLRRGHYIGLARLPGGVANVCLVHEWRPGDPAVVDAPKHLAQTLAGDRRLADRFRDARLVTRPTVLGPLAVDVARPDIDDLLLAGDAAGFVDPMTGDGLRFAVRGGELAALAALAALHRGWGQARRAVAAPQREFIAKRQFNRALRHLVASPTALLFGEVVAAAVPPAICALIRAAGDCALAS
jgi:flavin-dependent dehydrogenase